MPYTEEQLDRMAERALELLREYPAVSAAAAAEAAALIEIVLYGEPDAPPPVGLLGRSPLTDTFAQHQQNPSTSTDPIV